MNNLLTVEDMLAYLVAHPSRFSLAAFDVSRREAGVFHRADAVQPLASVYKIVVLYAFAREVAMGHLEAQEAVPLADVEAFYLPETDSGAHPRAMAEVTTEGAVTLDQLARAMITHSDNAATDYLIARIGRAKLDALPGVLGLEAVEAPVASSGIFALWKGPLGQPRPRNWTQRLLKMPRAEFSVAAERHLAHLRVHSEYRREVAEWALGNSRQSERRLSWTLPRGTAGAIADLLARVVSDDLQPAGTAAVMRRYLSWPLEVAPGLKTTFDDLGYKPGTITGVLTGAWYGRRKGAATPRVVALFLVDLPVRDFDKLLRHGTMQSFERRLLEDDAFFETVRTALTSQRQP